MHKLGSRDVYNFKSHKDALPLPRNQLKATKSQRKRHKDPTDIADTKKKVHAAGSGGYHFGGKLTLIIITASSRGKSYQSNWQKKNRFKTRPERSSRVFWKWPPPELPLHHLLPLTNRDFSEADFHPMLYDANRRNILRCPAPFTRSSISELTSDSDHMVANRELMLSSEQSKREWRHGKVKWGRWWPRFQRPRGSKKRRKSHDRRIEKPRAHRQNAAVGQWRLRCSVHLVRIRSLVWDSIQVRRSPDINKGFTVLYRNNGINFWIESSTILHLLKSKQNPMKLTHLNGRSVG